MTPMSDLFANPMGGNALTPLAAQSVLTEYEYQKSLQRYIDRQQAKPEVRRKLYDQLMANQAAAKGGGASGGGYQGRTNSGSPTAGTRPYLPAYTPPIPDASFPSGFVPVTQKDYPPFQDLHPGGTNPANDFKSPAPEDFVTPYNDPTAPRTQIWLGNGNLPDGFAPAPPAPPTVEPGQVVGKRYNVVLQGRSSSITYINQVDGSRYTQQQDAGVALIGVLPGKIGGVRIVAGATTPEGLTVPQTAYEFLIDYGIGTANPGTASGGILSGDTGSVSAGGLSISPENPNDPDPVSPGAAPLPPLIPTDPDTGRPNLPEIDLKPAIDAPTSPAQAPTPSPLNSPSGKPAPTARPDATPTFNPGLPLPFLPLPPPLIQNPLTPKSPSSPLANPALPIGNPGTPPSTGNPSKNLDLPGTGVTINGKPIQNGDTPIKQISPPQNGKSPLTTGTGVTINGQPVNPLVDVTKPNGTIDPQKAQQQQEQKQPQPQATPPRSTCADPCIQGLQDGMSSGNDLLQKIANTVGVTAFPVQAQLLTDTGATGTTTYKNLAELAVWNTKNLDAVTGLFPLEIPIVDGDGKESNVKIESVSHAFYELFNLLKVIAEDADAAVNVGSRAIIEAIQSKIAARQAGEYAKGNAKFLGYLGQGQVREIKLTVTPAAAGADNKLQNQEIKEFLEPSTQTYVGWECVEKVSLLPIVQRTLEDGEIARSALYHPFKEGKKPEQSTIPGTSIKYDRRHIKAQEKAWEQFKEDLKKEGKIIDDKQGQKDVKP
ncbi:hypothetical protein ACKFKG_26720 [Phormidesmis sp. 146-35]